MKDLTLDKDYKKGMKGTKVKLIQEWLCLHKIHLQIDSDFGPATDAAVRSFQKKNKLKVDGVVGPNTFEKLVEPMETALELLKPGNKSLGELVVIYANRHLEQHPMEIGGQNRGPWVRRYMDGHEGTQWAWCAGFVCFILAQACTTLDIPMPIESSFSCDYLAANAKKKNIFISESKLKDKSILKPGSIFLNRRTATDWTHTGIVISAEKDVIHTIEGNTNDEGSREGYEVCQRIRGYGKKDFILI